MSARCALAVLTTLLLLGCETTPKITTNADPSANLSTYKTFAFLEPLSTDKSSYTSILTTRLKSATQRELEKHGLVYDSAAPQLLVNFNVNVQEKTDVQSMPAAGGYYGYRSGLYAGWAGYPQDIQTIHYREGTLGIDLVDAAKRQLVWQGVAVGEISEKARENQGEAVDKVVAQVMAKYPSAGAAPK
jgi:hypothetical protein